MNKPVTLTFATYGYDRMRPILDGRVQVEGARIAPVILSSEDLFPRAVQRAEFDVCELSMSSYLMQVSRGTSQYTAVPAFASRAFRHDCIYVNAQSGIKTPKDLEGKRVGVPEYQATMVVWVRGILQDEHGVDFRSLKYRNGGINQPGRKERLPLELPDDIDIEPVPAGDTLNDLLVRGDLDAVIAPQMLKSFAEGQPQVRRLFDDPAAAAKAYYQKTGFFPVMHVMAVRTAILEEHPSTAARVFTALIEARNIAYGELQQMAEYSSSTLMLPFYAADLGETKALMGQNYWSYGAEENRTELETLFRYSHEQHLSQRLLTLEDVFAAETLKMPGN